MAKVGREKPAILDAEGHIRDLSGVVVDFAGEALGRESLSRIKALDFGTLPLVEGSSAPRGAGRRRAQVPRHRPQLSRPCRGNRPADSRSADRVRQGELLRLGSLRPDPPAKGFDRMDFEVELAVVIGTRAKNVSEADALDHVAGYCICDDVSERSLQKGGPGEWIKAKSYDSFGPLGPWLVTTDEVPDPQALDLTLDLNGTRMQTGNTSTMIFTRGAARELYQPLHDARCPAT